MDKSNVTHLPTHRPNLANDAKPGPLRFGIPSDVLDSADARRRAGLATPIRDRARPTPFETATVMLPGDPYPRRATVMCAPPDRAHALIKFHHPGLNPQAPMTAWVDLTQITYPNRDQHCGVA